MTPRYPLAITGPPDLGSSSEATLAFGLEEPPLISGRRGTRKGEAHWRYVGPDACDRLEAAMERLVEQGWTNRDDVGSRGSDGRQHMVVLWKGSEVVRFSYQEGRTGLLQDEWWTSTNGGPQVHHVEGPELDAAVWLHYWNESNDEELRELLGQAEAMGDRDDFVAHLTRNERERLGLAVESDSDGESETR